MKFILIILSLAFLIRLVSINQSLWLDEAISVVYGSSTSFEYFVSQYPIGDFHPPGFFAILWVWIKLFGNSEISVRFPSIIFGVLTILLTYLVGRELFNKKIGLLASIFLSLAPLHIYYSQEARMYSFAAFAVILSTYFLIKTIQLKKYTFLLYGLSLSLVLYSDYLAYLILPVHFIYIVFFHKKGIRSILLSYLITLLFFTPWLIIFPTQLINGLQTSSIVKGWSEVVGGATLKQILLLPIKIIFGKVSINNFYLYTFLALVLSIPYLFSFYKAIKKGNEKTFLLLTSIIFPITGAILISFFIPVFSYFRFIFILPFFYLLLAYGSFQLKESLRKFLVIFIIFVEAILSGIYLFNPIHHREDWKGAVEFTTDQKFKENAIVFENNQVLAPFEYYFQKENDNQTIIPGLKKIPAETLEDIKDFDKIDERGILLFEYLIEITDPRKFLMKKLERSGYKKIETYDFRGVGFVHLFSR